MFNTGKTWVFDQSERHDIPRLRSSHRKLPKLLAPASTYTIDLRNTLLNKQWLGRSFWSPEIGKQGDVAVLISPKCSDDIVSWNRRKLRVSRGYKCITFNQEKQFYM